MTIDRDSLEPGEQLLWSGGPEAEAYIGRYSWSGFGPGLALMAAAFLLLAFEPLVPASFSAATLVSLLFLAAAVLLVMALRRRRQARHTQYGVTNRRAIIEMPGVLLRNRVSVPFNEIRRIEVKPPGDLLFRDYVSESENGQRFIRDGFLALPNVYAVEQLLRSAIERWRAQEQPQ
jgi:hypothetical protein